MKLASIEQAASMYGRLDMMMFHGLINFPDYAPKQWRLSPKAVHLAYNDPKLAQYMYWNNQHTNGPQFLGLPFVSERVLPDWAEATVSDGPPRMEMVTEDLVQIVLELEDGRGRRVYMNERGEKE